jgi:hypothetical protein
MKYFASCPTCRAPMELKGPGEAFYDLDLTCDRDGRVLKTALDRELLVDDLFGHYQSEFTCPDCGRRVPLTHSPPLDWNAVLTAAESDPTLAEALPRSVPHRLDLERIGGLRLVCPQHPDQDRFKLVLLLRWVGRFFYSIAPDGRMTAEAVAPGPPQPPVFNELRAVCARCGFDAVHGDPTRLDPIKTTLADRLIIV